MKAYYMTAYGGPEVMQYGDVPAPSVRKGESIVQVRAVSLNPLDWKIRNGQTRFITGRKFPKILGADFAGEIKELNGEMINLTVGDRVYGSIRIYLKNQGALAEEVAVPIKALHKIPEGCSYEEAAALPIAALTALNGLRLCGNLENKNIVVNGATGGVGHFAVQMAIAAGASITAVSSTKNLELARTLGAQRVINYTEENITKKSEKYDIFFDAYGKVKFTDAQRILEKRGIFATTLGMPGVMLTKLWNTLIGKQKVVLANYRGKAEDYRALEKQIEKGKVKPLLGKVFPFRETHRAFEASEKGGVAGKIIISLEDL